MCECADVLRMCCRCADVRICRCADGEKCGCADFRAFVGIVSKITAHCKLLTAYLKKAGIRSYR
jgi:hypothetical protein